MTLSKISDSLGTGWQRVDKVAASLFSEFSRAELSRWLQEGALTLDSAAVKAKHKVLAVSGCICKLGSKVVRLGTNRNKFRSCTL